MSQRQSASQPKELSTLIEKEYEVAKASVKLNRASGVRVVGDVSTAPRCDIRAGVVEFPTGYFRAFSPTRDDIHLDMLHEVTHLSFFSLPYDYRSASKLFAKAFKMTFNHSLGQRVCNILADIFVDAEIFEREGRKFEKQVKRIIERNPSVLKSPDAMLILAGIELVTGDAIGVKELGESELFHQAKIALSPHASSLRRIKDLLKEGKRGSLFRGEELDDVLMQIATFLKRNYPESTQIQLPIPLLFSSGDAFQPPKDEEGARDLASAFFEEGLPLVSLEGMVDKDLLLRAVRRLVREKMLESLKLFDEIGKKRGRAISLLGEEKWAKGYRPLQSSIARHPFRPSKWRREEEVVIKTLEHPISKVKGGYRNMVLLLDTSGSTALPYEGKPVLYWEKLAVLSCLGIASRYAVPVTVVAFDDSAYVVASKSRKYVDIGVRVLGLYSRGGTDLGGAILRGAGYVSPKTLFLIITDGEVDPYSLALLNRVRGSVEKVFVLVTPNLEGNPVVENVKGVKVFHARPTDVGGLVIDLLYSRYKGGGKSGSEVELVPEANT